MKLAFCIVGAPKAATTSLAKYLGEHPGVCMPSWMKEPRYYCLDDDRYRQVRTRRDYERLWAHAEPGQLCGEASAAYLYSEPAVPVLLADNPACKLICMVRNPIDLVVSLHAQKLASQEETIADFEMAWRLSPARRRSRLVGPRCDAPRYLDYQEIGRLGAQVGRLKSRVPPCQLHMIVYDDIAADVRKVYLDTLEFLGLPDDGRMTFETHNPRRRLLFPAVIRMLKAGPARAVKRRIKSVLPQASHAVGSRFYAAVSTPAERIDLDPELRAEMVEHFRDDVALLGRLIGRDLSEWLA